MKGRKITVSILLFTIIIAGAINVQAASVSLNVTSSELYTGQTMDVNVIVDPEDAGIAGVQIDVFFDGNTLEPVAVKEGNFLNQNGSNTFFSDMAPGSNSISNIVGVILGNSNVTNRNVFATITFKAISAGTSFIELKNVKVSNPGGNLLATNVSSRAALNIISDKNNNGNGGNRGGGGGGGGSGTTGENISNIEVREKYDLFINKDLKTTYIFKRTDPILSVNITGNINAGEINVAVEILRNTSSLVKGPASDVVYKNANIWVGTYGFATPTNIKNAEITFRVPVSWMESNSIDPDSITMKHYQGAWAPLPTKKIRGTSEWIYYEANTTRFSPHAITGKRSSSGSYNISLNDATTKYQQTESSKGNGKEGPLDQRLYLILGAFVGVAVIAALIYKKRKSEKDIFN